MTYNLGMVNVETGELHPLWNDPLWNDSEMQEMQEMSAMSMEDVRAWCLQQGILKRREKVDWKIEGF